MNDSHAPLQGIALTAASFAVAVASFMNVLDITIVVVSIPTIAGNLSATASQGSWVITMYSVCLAAILPLSGWITRRFGLVHTFCLSVLMFTFASWLCAEATSFNTLLFFRAIQGAAGGLLLPLSQSLLLRIYPPERHGYALSIWGLTSATAPVVGPLLGGYLTDTVGWPWVFYVNVPIGLLSAWICWSLLRNRDSETVREPVDAVGLVLMVVGVISGQVMLDRGHELDWLASTEVRVLLALSLVCLALFLAWERDERHPIVDLSLFMHRNFMVGTLFISIFYGTFITASVIFPIWMQTVLGYTARWSGLLLAPTMVAPLMLMALVGANLHRLNAKLLIFTGCMMMAISFWMHVRAGTDATPRYIITARLLFGFGMPFTWTPLMVQSLVGLPPEKIATAAGLFNFMRMLASSFGTAVGVTLWDQRSTFHRSHLVELIARDTPDNASIMQQLGSLGYGQEGMLQALDWMVFRQARSLGAQDVFNLAAVMMACIAIGGLVFGRNATQPTQQGIAHD